MQWVWPNSPHVCTSFWEPEIVPVLLEDHTARNLMYIEVMAHIDNGEDYM